MFHPRVSVLRFVPVARMGRVFDEPAIKRFERVIQRKKKSSFELSNGMSAPYFRLPSKASGGRRKYGADIPFESSNEDFFFRWITRSKRFIAGSSNTRPMRATGTNRRTLTRGWNMRLQ